MKSLRTPVKLTALLSAFLLLFSLIIPATQAQADELSGRTLEKELREMIAEEILSGYDDGTYRPTEEVSRGQFAAFIARALTLPVATGSFKDVAKSSKLAEDIYRVQQAGIMNGYGGNRFKPDSPITREQISLTMMNVLTYSEMVLQETRISFTDLNEFQSSGSIRAAFYNINYGIISGIPDKEDSMRFEPKTNATREQAAAFISRYLTAVDAYEPPSLPEIPQTPEQPTPKPPVKPVPPKPQPPVTEGNYYLATIENGKLKKQPSGLKEYSTAANQFNSEKHYKAMYRGNELIRIRSGFAFGDNTTRVGAKENTIIYFDPEFKKQATYIEQGREMKYLGSNDDYVKVQVGATVGYAKHSQVDLIPIELVTNRDHYTVSQWGTLTHYIYNYMAKKKNSYYVQLAPDFLKNNGTYHSQDGVHFYETNGQFAGAFLPYFQFLSARSTTNYSGKELDALIMSELKDRETRIGGRYKDATKKSKLIGLGTFFKELEKNKQVNALLILSLAVHESDYGMSPTAQTCNNLFGLYKSDSLTKLCPDKGTFKKPSDSAVSLVENFLNPNYLDPTNQLGRALGAAFGNKTTGFNVNYASDPTWGAKAGAHMYDLDKAAGGKDMNHFRQFALTKLEIATNIRTAPTTSSPILFTYKARHNGTYQNTSDGLPLGYPLTVISSVQGDDGRTWYKVFSDQAGTQFGYVSEDVVNIVTNETH